MSDTPVGATPAINYCKPSPLTKTDATPAVAPISVGQFERLQRTYFEFATHACAQMFRQHPTDPSKSLVAVRWTPSYSRMAEKTLRGQLTGSKPTINTRIDPATGEVIVERKRVACETAAGGNAAQARAFCASMDTYLEEITKEPEQYKPYDPHDPENYSPAKWGCWAKQIDHASVAAWFVGLGVVANWATKKFTGKSIAQHVKDFFKNGNGGNGTGGVGKTDNRPPIYDGQGNLITKMVAGAAVLLGALAEAARRMPPPAPQIETACKHPSGFCLPPGTYDLDTDSRRYVVYYMPAPDFGRIAKAAALTVFTAAAAIFGPKVMPKSLLNPQTAPAGFGGFGVGPRGNLGTPEVL